LLVSLAYQEKPNTALATIRGLPVAKSKPADDGVKKCAGQSLKEIGFFSVF
jgi:hypothetical protein